MDLALNNLQRLVCHKTQKNQQPTNYRKNLYKKKLTVYDKKKLAV